MLLLLGSARLAVSPLFRGLSPRPSGREAACQCRRLGCSPWVGKVSWRRKWQPDPVFLQGESHGQRSLVGYHLKGLEKSDTTELHTLCSWGSRDLSSDCAGLASVLPLLPPSAPGHIRPPHLETPRAGNFTLSPAPGRRAQQACSSTPAGRAGTPAPDQRLHPRVPRHRFYRAAILDPFHRFRSPFPSAVFQVHCSDPIIPPFKSLLWLPHCPTDTQTP